ncbi:MAG: thioredoxin domain-containing protein [Geminocystis sp.]|nr:thioredoxin domain-containing protein [Geminocystis sp.]MCS7148770.1 thioredoxin domain-containing protein [Geminocystis sp.]MCX8078672.1 thioredoxin domain-containing protein [Geminocystis sp.]MDW8115392.1 thioredoxin domain-containing protein [Geminocystis sp.]MDW8462934.1 thioredoxin domain-containing protein [Geminocystis sp.]
MPNRLLHCNSLYLRKHAYNPVNWYPWGEEALTRAKQEDKPIFLSIGYSSCHWCTVMEKEAFSDATIASYLNEHFICIKVDREERPDLDSIYMTALQMMTGQGGWPLNIFLTPDDLVPFYGGTYFPIEPRYGLPGFLQILQAVHDYYHNQKDKLNAFKSHIVNGLLTNVYIPSPGEAISLNQNLLQEGIAKNYKVIHRDDYGTPRFPMIPHVNLILEAAVRDHEYLAAVVRRGLDLVNGGIYDHVGGGFHRYTVDSTWTVPHFEKMLYDNGLILEFLANLWAMGIQNPQIERACQGILHWLKREMTASEGYFYASQDADSFTHPDDDEPEEGSFYVWSYDELKQILSDEELAALSRAFIITKNGNFEGKNVLQKREDEEIDELVEQALDKLFFARYGASRKDLSRVFCPHSNEEVKNRSWLGRVPPVTDPKMIVSWNSLMVSGLARAYGVFQDEEYLQVAEKAITFILNNQWPSGRLHRLNYGGEATLLAQSEDYSFLIKALLDLAQNCPQKADYYLERAIEIQIEFDHYFTAPGEDIYNNNAYDDCKDLMVVEKSYADSAIPSPNGIAAINLLRLYTLTEMPNYLERAEKILNKFSGVMKQYSTSCPTLFSALHWYLKPTIVRTTPEVYNELIRQYYPATTLIIDSQLPPDSVGFVCKGMQCLPPATDISQLKAQITNS